VGVGLCIFGPLACKSRTAAAPDAWERIDLWSLKPDVEVTPVANRWFHPTTQRISFLGAAEVRDMSKVPAAQLVNFPHRPAGQIRAIEQVAASRVRWRVQLGKAPYLSFVPLGFERPCACTYRVTVGPVAGKTTNPAIEVYRAVAPPIRTFAPPTVTIDLARWASGDVDGANEVDLRFEVLGTGERAGGKLPGLLWGSPAVYGRHALPAPAGRLAPKRPNILLIGVDTLRADAVGAWGRTPSLTPEIDALSAESDVYLDTYTAFNVTNPSFISIMTGLYGKNHGVYDLETPLPRTHVTLAEHLRQAGYATMAVLSASHLQDVNSGLGQGFDEMTRAGEHFAGELSVDMTIDWLAARTSREASPDPKGSPQATAAKPFFIWLHLFDPHTPHTPPEPFASGYEPSAPAGLGPVATWIPYRTPGPRAFEEDVLGASKDLYYGEVAYLDRQVGRLLDFLRSRNLLDNTLVVLVADHGESLGEHGVSFRHVGLHDTTTHVPMMIRWPGRDRTGRPIHGLVQTIDLFPTLLTALELPIPPQDGEDLKKLTGEGRTGRRAVFAEHAGRLGLMVRTADWKYILSSGNTRFFPDGASLFDLRADPGENVNRAGQGLPKEKELEGLLQRFLADRRDLPRPTKRGDLTPEEESRLRGLGYVR
jgi:arylsulfatase A-like enzyme